MTPPLPAIVCFLVSGWLANEAYRHDGPWFFVVVFTALGIALWVGGNKKSPTPKG